MMEYLLQHLWAVWAVIAMFCLILEMSSGDFFITCFGIGALCALVASILCVPLWLQVIVFALFSVLSIYFLRPRLVALLHRSGGNRLSNADAIIGRVGEVTETVKAGGYGRVKLDGDDWKAQSDAPQDIPVGTKVEIVGRESIIVKVAVPQQ
ncbi:NfeD family protein [uncultured Prevotella sp.]|uniref:NfeD family protein n=1 Tax=uncultured Prevotella sp. TaxID=159272 RepID=UPI0027E23A25|nr:NfeD family protein [uncultured Prevotella sp.]